MQDDGAHSLGGGGVGGWSKSNNIKIMDFKRSDLNRLQELEEKVSWEVDLKDKRLQKGWQFLKETTSKTQMQTVLT